MARILVVDDDFTIQQAIAAVLSFEGHTVHVARNGQQALDSALRTAPDVILLDIAMPVMDGRAAARALRANPSTCAIPIILMSGASAIAAHAEDLPVDGTLAKPFDIAELVAVVAAQLERSAVAD